ncbi:30S ribosomal protein S8 [Desulfovermiculus halophilus]|jgi:small subunit ribosomal protein S8|uniref:30S ribosomal protein S8 n=1 Tax=Desulfovermiculus halophilus TaxID=339722 RepID=UPI00048A2E88|nr:30S ribosomal protein S8 [Desulfovermiculus halophilus]
MAVSDPIADMLTRIRNAHMALHKKTRVPKSKLKVSLAEILKNQGYITDFEHDDREIEVTLKYVRGKPAIAGLRRLSSPGCRQYVGVDEIPLVQNGLGINVISTSKGILDGQQARDNRVGGELLCEIW